MASMDKDGLIFFTGRKDSQVKIDGYRIELAEIEYHVRQNMPQQVNAVVIAALSNNKNHVLHLVVESEEFDLKPLMEKLKRKMPAYMIPAFSAFLPHFPLNANGKTDRLAIKTWIEREKI